MTKEEPSSIVGMVMSHHVGIHKAGAARAICFILTIIISVTSSSSLHSLQHTSSSINNRLLKNRPYPGDPTYQTFSGPLILLKLYNLDTMMNLSQKDLFEEAAKRFVEDHLSFLHRINVKIRSQLAERQREHSVTTATSSSLGPALHVLFTCYGFFDVSSTVDMSDFETLIQTAIRDRADEFKDLVVQLQDYDGYFRDVQKVEVLDSTEFEMTPLVEAGGIDKDRTRTTVKTSDEATILGVMLSTILLLVVAVTATKIMLYNDEIMNDLIIEQRHTQQDKKKPPIPNTVQKTPLRKKSFTTSRSIRHGPHGERFRTVHFVGLPDEADMETAAAEDTADYPSSAVDISLDNALPGDDDDGGNHCGQCVAPCGSMGVAIRETEDYPIIFDMKPGGPMEGKLKKYDKILAVDQIDTRGMTGDQFTELLESKNDAEKTISYMRQRVGTKMERDGIHLII